MTDKTGLQPLVRTESLAEHAYDAIRNSIAKGELVPGAPITERRLAADLGVSPTPVREALRKLEHEGLVERSGSRRLSVAAHPKETLEELMEIEILLRAAEARLAARKIADEDLGRMQALLEVVKGDIHAVGPYELMDLARDFDGVIAAAAANPPLRRMIESFAILGGDDRVRTIAQDAADPEWTRGRVEDHVAIYTALRDRDEDRVEMLMRQHARSAMQHLSPAHQDGGR